MGLFQRDRLAGRVADAGLENVTLSPRFLLLVLTYFDQDAIDPGLELYRRDVLIDLHAGMVDFISDDQLTVDPDFLSVDAPDAQFASHIAWTVELSDAVDNAAFFVVVKFRKIDQSVRIGTGLGSPSRRIALA